MPQTRTGRASNGSALEAQNVEKENVDPQELTKANVEPDANQGKKRKSSGGDVAQGSSTRKEKVAKKEEKPVQQMEKPRLTTPDIEFDFDRSQLRDPRPTPGRVTRPRHGSIELKHEDVDVLNRFRSDYHVPKPEKPKGRLNALQKDELYGQEALADPLKTFHFLHVCYAKGRDGLPTCDEAGFQLDFDKVANWMRPESYSKSKVMNRMDRALEKGATEDEQICEAFFVDGKAPHDPNHTHMILYIVKDLISKDIGVPWHQIGPSEARKWRETHEPVIGAKWWKPPNEVEKKRLYKMLGGAALRKHI